MSYSGDLFEESGLSGIGLGAGEEEETEVQFIVKKLNERLGTDYTLVQFSKQTGTNLLQILNNVLAKYQPDLAKDLKTEDTQTTCERLSKYLFSILNYRFEPKHAANEMEFQAKFAAAEPSLIHSILFWILQKGSELEMRVYLAKYLVPVQVPEEIRNSEEDVKEVYQQYIDLVKEFTDTHKQVRKLKGQADTQQITQELAAIQKEKEQIKGAIGETRKKLSRIPNHEKIFPATKALREEMEKQAQLQKSIIEQGEAKAAAELKLKQVMKRQQDAGRDFSELNVDRMISTIQEEIALNKALLNDKLPKELMEYHQKIEALSAVLNEHLDSETLHREVYALEKRVQQIEKEATPASSAEDQQSINIFRQQANVSQSRKATLQDELNKVTSQKTKVDELLHQKEAEMSKYRGNFPKGQQLQEFMRGLREKSEKYKKLKKELDVLQAENAVLQRTENILESQCNEVTSQLEQLERSKGISGHREIAQEMTTVSEKKSEIDNEKHQTLEELSKVVQQFVQNIRDRRNKLAPQILDLRNTRQKAQTVEQEWQQKKEIFEANKGELENEVHKLQQEVDQYRDECRIHESFYHKMNCQMLLFETQNKRVQDEKEFRAGGRTLSQRHKSYAEMFDNHVSELERVSKELRERKKEIDENHSANIQQMALFKNLKKLLDCKLNVLRRGDNRSGLAGVDMGNIGGGVERLIISS